MPAATKLVVLPELRNQFHLSSQIDNMCDWKDYFGENIYILFHKTAVTHCVKVSIKGIQHISLNPVNVPDIDIRTNAIIVTKADVKCRHFNSHAVGHFQYYFLKVSCQTLDLMKKKFYSGLEYSIYFVSNVSRQNNPSVPYF